MTLFLLALWRQLRAQPWATVSVVLGISLAMASVVAVHLLTARIATELASAYPASLAGLNYQYRQAALTEQDYFDLRKRWRRGELTVVRRSTGEQLKVSGLAPLIEGQRRIAGEDWTILGFDPLALPATTGLAISVPDLLLRDAVLAHRGSGLADGDRLQPAEGPLLAVTGMFGADDEPGRRWLLADLVTARQVLGLDPIQVDAVGLVIERPVPQSLAVLDRWFPGLATQWTASGLDLQLDGALLLPLGDQAQRSFVDSILFNLGALSLLAALVAGFLVYQSGVSALRQRLLLLTRLRALGLPESLIRAHLLAEGLLLGLLGALFGLLFGVLLARGLLLLLGGGVADASGPELGAVPLEISLEVVLKALLFGAGSAVLGIWLAYLRVAQPSDQRPRPVHRQTRLARLLRRQGPFAWSGQLLGVAAMLIGWGLPATGTPGAFLAITGAALLALGLLPVLLQAGSGGLLRISRVGALRWLLNLRELRATLPDVQAAGGALMLALAVAMGIGLMVGSLRDSFAEMLDQRLAAGLVVQSSAGFSVAERAHVVDHPAVDDVRFYADMDLVLQDPDSAAGPQLVRAQVSQLDAWELARYGLAPAGDPASESARPIVAISEPLVRMTGLRPGQQVTLTAVDGDGQIVAEVLGVFRDYGAARPRVLLDRETAVTAGLLPASPALPEQLSLQLAPDADVEALRTWLSGQGWRTQSMPEIRALSERIFDRTFRITDALAMLALLVAVVGLYNALTALQLKRTQELRLLHGMGMGDSALASLCLTQALLLAALLALMALPLGLAIAWLLGELVNPRAFGWSIPLTFNMAPLLWPVVLAMLAAVAGGLLPALRAVRLASGQDGAAGRLGEA